jgi:hypothetical protein
LRHRIVCRFSVPRADAATASRHADPAWLAGRLELFERWFAPSVGRLGVPVSLLCSSASAALVADRVRGHAWATVEEQDDWRGGTRAADFDLLTRLDSDDALSAGWFASAETLPPASDVAITRRFLRIDTRRRSLHAYHRREPSPLAAFRRGLEPYAFDHATLASHYRCHELDGEYLLQVVHGGNLSSRAPRWWRFHRRLPLARLAEFGLA